MGSWFLDARNCKFGSSLEFILGGAVLVERSFIISIFEQFPGSGTCRCVVHRYTALLHTTPINLKQLGQFNYHTAKIRLNHTFKNTKFLFRCGKKILWLIFNVYGVIINGEFYIFKLFYS